MPLCSLCEQVTPWSLRAIRFNGANVARPETCNPHHRSFLALQDSSHECELCRLMCNSLLDNKYNPSIQLQQDLPILVGSVLDRYFDLQIDAPQVHNIVVQCGESFTVLHAFANPQSDAAMSHAVAGRLPLQPDSQEHFKMIATWLEECKRNHPACRIDRIGQKSKDAPLTKTSKLPRRVVDVGICTDSTVRLFESPDSEGEYVALSHRWPTDPSKHYTTTRATIKNRKRAMSLEDMPKTFQDAVTVSRELGFRYLWIDSLCIIQDDPADWDQQSVLMGQIYYRATITIMSATTPIPSKKMYQEDSPEGFLYRIPELSRLLTVKMDYYDEDWRMKGNWFIQYRQQYISNNLDLLTRGWVLQEELLSRRKIIYAPDQVLWQCRSLQAFEVNRDIKTNFERFKDYGSWEDREFSDHWLGSAELYSYRNLTFELDKLPALSGLALHFSQRHGQEYYAGIFSGSVAEGLLWAPSYAGCLSRPKNYIAPSWSWTSMIGSIKMLAPQQMPDVITNNVPPIKSALEDVRFELSPEGQNPYGRLKGGHMEVTGWLKRAEMSRQNVEAHLLMDLHANGKSMGSFTLDLAEYAPTAKSTQEVECLCALHGHENVLVLRKPRNLEVYERIGIATVDPAWFGERNARKERITII